MLLVVSCMVRLVGILVLLMKRCLLLLLSSRWVMKIGLYFMLLLCRLSS